MVVKPWIKKLTVYGGLVVALTGASLTEWAGKAYHAIDLYFEDQEIMAETMHAYAEDIRMHKISIQNLAKDRDSLIAVFSGNIRRANGRIDSMAHQNWKLSLRIAVQDSILRDAIRRYESHTHFLESN